MAAQIPEQIAGLLIPMVGRPIVLPNVTVAEIVSWRKPFQGDVGAPAWLLGRLEWRGLQIPLISLELMGNADLDDALEGKRIAVVNSMGKSQWPFYALAIQGIPRLVRVYPEEITQEEHLPERLPMVWQIAVNGERMMVPDLDYVETQLNQFVAA
ncbi:CheW-like protein [gamma proteobacterium HdN1]|nr:CheW-like protein [gamma proteobacterium HdN1]